MLGQILWLEITTANPHAHTAMGTVGEASVYVFRVKATPTIHCKDTSVVYSFCSFAPQFQHMELNSDRPMCD